MAQEWPMPIQWALISVESAGLRQSWESDLLFATRARSPPPLTAGLGARTIIIKSNKIISLRETKIDYTFTHVNEHERINLNFLPHARIVEWRFFKNLTIFILLRKSAMIQLGRSRVKVISFSLFFFIFANPSIFSIVLLFKINSGAFVLMVNRYILYK